jgi:hypothetical protein
LAVLLEGVFILKNMYLPKKENLEKLSKLYDSINWDLEYDKLYLKEKEYNDNKRLKEKRKNSDESIREENYTKELRCLYDKYKLHIKNGGTKFGFICILNENKTTFKCVCCSNHFLIEDISFSITNKINVGPCSKCNTKNTAKWTKQKRKTDDIFRFKSNVRGLIYSSFKRKVNNDWKKNSKTEDILKCKLDFFKNYIESKFTKDMTFENYGKWHLDHIKPLALAKSEEDVILLNHYTNFQPLWAKDNLKKRDKY